MTTFTGVSKNSTSFSDSQSKSVTPFTRFLRHGKEPLISDLEDYTFESVIFPDGTQLKDVTFAELGDIVWANISKS